MKKYHLFQTLTVLLPFCLLFWYTVWEIGCAIARQAGI
jgi:hypothetical protein